MDKRRTDKGIVATTVVGDVRRRQAILFEVVVTDTVPVPAEKRWDRLVVLSIAPLLAEAIRRISTGESISALFG